MVYLLAVHQLANVLLANTLPLTAIFYHTCFVPFLVFLVPQRAYNRLCFRTLFALENVYQNELFAHRLKDKNADMSIRKYGVGQHTSFDCYFLPYLS